MEAKTFNLIDEPWIPCILSDGRSVELGLKEVLLKAHEIQEIYDLSPLVTISLHRLLLAILHRNFGPENSAKWGELWNRGKFDYKNLNEYFDKWNERFDLFHNEHPFYQTIEIELDECTTGVAKLAEELASGNNPTLFDHTFDVIVSPSYAARLIIGVQATRLPGLVSWRKNEDAKTHKSAKTSPLAKSAITLLKKENLFQTLVLNMHWYSSTDEEPFHFDINKDIPAWERDEAVKAKERKPDGYLDLLTWQSRRARIKPERINGKLIVKYCSLMKGYSFPDNFTRHGKETMVAFWKREKAKPNQDPWPAISLQEDRALWRDSLSLFQSIENKQSRPMLLDWIADLVDDSILDRSLVVPIDVCGLSTEKRKPAKPNIWRHERLPLSLKYLQDEKLLDKLKEALQLAEDVGKLLTPGFDKQFGPRPVQILAELFLPEQHRQDDVTKLIDSLSPCKIYWSQLEVHFKMLLVNLAEDVSEEDGDIHYGRKELPQWAESLRNTANTAFMQACKAVGTSARALQAVAVAENKFNIGLSSTLKNILSSRKEVHNE